MHFTLRLALVALVFVNASVASAQTGHPSETETFLPKERVLYVYDRAPVMNEYLRANADKVHDELTLQTLVAMAHSGIGFDEDAYSVILNEGYFWILKSAGQRVILNLLKRPNPEVWFPSQHPSVASHVSNDLQGALVLHFADLHDQLQEADRVYKNAKRYASYVLEGEVVHFYKGMVNTEQLAFAKAYFTWFPSEARIKEFQQYANRFFSLPLHLIHNSYQTDFALELVREAEALKTLNRPADSVAPATQFANRLSKLYSAQALVVFREALRQSLEKGSLQLEAIDALPDCNTFLGG